MSVLSALRACVSSETRPRVEGDVIHLQPPAVLPRKSASSWRYRKGGYLDLESIVFFVLNQQLPLAQYVKACADLDVQIVPFAERKPLLEYLQGDKDSHAYSEIDQDREQLQEHKHQRKMSSGTSSRRGSAPFVDRLPQPAPAMRSSSVESSVRLPGWAWWWLLLASIVMAFDATYLFLRPHSLPKGSLHRYFSVYDAYLVYDPTYEDIHDPFTHALAISESTQLALNLATLALATTLPHSAWPAVLALATAGGTLCVTAFFFLYEAMSESTQRYRLGDVSTWDAGYVLGYVCVSSLWIVFPLAVIVSIGEQMVRLADWVDKTKKH